LTKTTTTTSALTRQRLANQQLVRPRLQTPGELVHRLGAVQAQDYLGSLWAVGQRLASARESDVEDALAAGALVRTWPMRGTLHYVAAADVRWMLALCAPRVIARSAGRYRELELDEAAFGRSGEALVGALQGGRRLTRQEAYAVIGRGGVSTAGQRGIHILGHLAQKGVLCLGPRQGRQPTFVLLDEWVPAARPLPRDQALATLATRYFASHGPATVQDFAWWSGLLVKDALAGIEAAGVQVIARDGDGRSWRSATARRARPWAAPVAALLPPWDEYVVGYQDREATVRPRQGQRSRLQTVGSSLVTIDGLVRGTWRRTLGTARVRVAFEFWGKPTASERAAVHRAVLRYGRFLGKDVEIA
jgi:hypothetical protein